MQVDILNGIYATDSGEFGTSYPVNLIPVPKDTGISKGYLRPQDGIVTAGAGPGMGRGGINWNGILYRVMGTKLVSIAEDGTVSVLGDVGGSSQVSLDYSFDKLGVASHGRLFYWDGTTLAPVTDPDIGNVIDTVWIAGYWLSTDGTSAIVTELNDPFSVNPLKYTSAESDPDPIMAVDKLVNQAIALGRYTIEFFQNIGGTLAPFATVEGAQIRRGIIGTHMYAPLLDSFAFVGSGRKEAPAVYLMGAGTTVKLSTREIDQRLLTYSEAVLASCLVESKIDKNHQLLFIHLPDVTLVYDASATIVIGEPVWFYLNSVVVGNGPYRARNLVWAYDDWQVEDCESSNVGTLTSKVASHYGAVTGWEFSAAVNYNTGNDAIVHELELVALPGRVQLTDNPTIWTSYSKDGETWSQEKAIRAGRFGERGKRLAWRDQGTIGQYRIQRFRGTSESHMSIARLEVQFEALVIKS